MDFLGFSAVFRAVALLWSMWTAAAVTPVVLPAPGNAFEMAFPSIDADGFPKCVELYSPCPIREDVKE